jgi:hypothetical protein
MEKQAGVAASRQSTAIIPPAITADECGGLPTRRYDRFSFKNPVNPVYPVKNDSPMSTQSKRNQTQNSDEGGQI